MRVALLAITIGILSVAPTITLAEGVSAEGAPQDLRRSQIAAATADALDRLREEVEEYRISPDLTVGSLVERTSGQEQLRHILIAAEQIGGTRWIDDNTPQVRMEISGDAIVPTLLQLISEHPKSIAQPVEVLRDKFGALRARTFSATGTSTAQLAVERLRPRDGERAWDTVDEKERRQAIAAAKQNAVTRVLDSVRTVEIQSGKTIGDALSSTGDASLRDWLQNRPVVAVEFRDDLVVQLSLAAPPGEVWTVLEQSLRRQQSIPIPAAKESWSQLRKVVLDRMAAPTGRSVVVVAVSTHPRPAVVIPADPPRWVGDTMDAEAAARPTGRLLRTARAAEGAADERLRARLETLLLAPGLTLGDAARKDPRVAQALTRSVAHAKVYKVDYDYPDPGAVRVRVSLSLDDVWRELSSR